MPAHPMALALLRAAEFPSPRPARTASQNFRPPRGARAPELGIAVDMILDGGPCTVGIESTVISLAGGRPRILRPGSITQPRIEAVIGPVETGSGTESPGQHPRHYSPRTPIVLGDSPREGRGIRLDRSNMPAEAAAYAERLYRVLHDLDAQGYDWIAIEPPPDTPEWAGIRDRLQRAAK